MGIKKELKLPRTGNLLIFGWTLLLAVILVWNCFQIRREVQKEALITLRLTLDRDLAFRAWATKQGGVYLPVGLNAEPNPYLHHIADRDLVTSQGQLLTLFNPAYIMRQVYEMDQERSGTYGRLISLRPVNPGNEADPWETASLQAFGENSHLEEISTIADFDGENSLRLIKPFYMEEGCLKCHGDQGYEVGDLRGGISASRPLAPYNALIRSRQFFLLLGYGLIWLVGSGGIALFLNRIRASAQDLQEQEARNRAMVEAIPDMLFRYSKEGEYLDAEIKDHLVAAQLMSAKTGGSGFRAQKITSVLPREMAENLLQAIAKVIATGKMQIVEHTCIVQQKQVHLEERLVLEGENEVVSIVRDVTKQKELEARLRYWSFHDELTGLYNRNYFENELKRLNRSREYPISIIYADVNDLKLANDTLGHAAGDQLLQVSAKILKESLRGSDILARVGGDEFVAILPRTNQKQSREIVQRIKNRVSDCRRKHPDLPLSLAIGSATTVGDAEELPLTCKRADDRMYQEKLKRGGREGEENPPSRQGP